MPRADKVQAVAAIKDRIEGANAVFLAEYSGLSVKDQQTLRRSLRSGGAEFKVVKMTLARLAAEELEIDTLNDLLLGPTGLAFADDDAVVAAKALRDFAKEHDVFRIKGGLLGRDFLTPSASASWPRSSRARCCWVESPARRERPWQRWRTFWRRSLAGWRRRCSSSSSEWNKTSRQRANTPVPRS